MSLDRGLKKSLKTRVKVIYLEDLLLHISIERNQNRHNAMLQSLENTVGVKKFPLKLSDMHCNYVCWMDFALLWFLIISFQLGYVKIVKVFLLFFNLTWTHWMTVVNALSKCFICTFIFPQYLAISCPFHIWTTRDLIFAWSKTVFLFTLCVPLLFTCSMVKLFLLYLRWVE